MRVNKLYIFKKLLDQNIKPPSSEFESKVVSELKNEISKKVDLQYLAPQSFEKVDNLAKHFKSEMLILWRSSKVSPVHNSNTPFYAQYVCIYYETL